MSKISPKKAREILQDGSVRGRKLTDKQRKFFGAMAAYAEGGPIDPFDPMYVKPPKPSIQKLGNIEFDSNAARPTGSHPNRFVVKDIKTGKDYGVKR